MKRGGVVIRFLNHKRCALAGTGIPGIVGFRDRGGVVSRCTDKTKVSVLRLECWCGSCAGPVVALDQFDQCGQVSIC